MSRAAVVLAAAWIGCNSSSGSTQPPPPAKPPIATARPADLQAGAKTYATYCAPCHAADGKGYTADHAPSLVTSTFLESATDSFLIDSIELGRPGTSMAAYGRASGGPLDGNAVRDLVAWIRAQNPVPVVAAALELPPTGGDATRGHAVFTTNCEKCHGNEQVRGDFASLSNPRFLASASDAFIYHALVSGRPGTLMVAWQPALPAQDIADVIAYIRSLQRAPGINRMPPPTGKEPLFANPTGAPPSFTGHGDPCPQTDLHCKSDPRFVPADQVKAALDAGKKLVLIDARNESEWEVVHVTGAVSIPYSKMARLDEIPKDAWIVAYCACPHHLSGLVVDELEKRGYAHAFVLDEGINEWQRRGYPIVAAPGTPMPPAEPHRARPTLAPKPN